MFAGALLVHLQLLGMGGGGAAVADGRVSYLRWSAPDTDLLWATTADSLLWTGDDASLLWADTDGEPP